MKKNAVVEIVMNHRLNNEVLGTTLVKFQKGISWNLRSTMKGAYCTVQ